MDYPEFPDESYRNDASNDSSSTGGAAHPYYCDPALYYPQPGGEVDPTQFFDPQVCTYGETEAEWIRFTKALHPTRIPISRLSLPLSFHRVLPGATQAPAILAVALLILKATMTLRRPSARTIW